MHDGQKSLFCEHKSPLPPNKRAALADKKVALMLYHLKDSGSLNMAVNIFDIAICTTSAIINEVCNLILKQFHSLKVQTVYDHKVNCMGVDCLWRGSACDSKAFTNSSVNSLLRNSALPQTFQITSTGTRYTL